MFDGVFFLKLIDGPAAHEIVRKPNAWALLTLIALRAWKGRGMNLHGLRFGECFIGDHRECGLTRREYRTAQGALSACRLAVFRGTNRGTIARLCGSDVYDIGRGESGQQTANERPARGQQEASKSDYREQNQEGEGARDASSPSPSPAAGPSGDTAGLASEIPARWRPAFDALAATGKLPQLRGIHLVMADRAHPGARLAEAEGFGEIVADALGMRGPVGDVASWLRAKCSALEVRRLGLGRRGAAPGAATDRAARAASVAVGIQAEW